MDHNLYDEEDDPLPAAEGASRALMISTRHDGFTPKRRRKFIKTLRKTGCVRDACRKAGVSDSAAYKARRRDPEFRAAWATALCKAGGDLEVLAWQRAVEGVEEDVVAYGKVIGHRRKHDAHLFRMLLKASNPGRYGGQGFGSRKAMEKKIRAEIEAEEEGPSFAQEEKEAVVARLVRKIAALRQRMIADGRIRESRTLDGFFEDDDEDDEPGPAGDENGRDRTESGEDWTDPEPPFGRPERAPRDREPRISAENRPGEPRITFL